MKIGNRAKAYAEYIMNTVAYCLDKDAITDLLADAYEQGWVDRERKSFNDTLREKGGYK